MISDQNTRVWPAGTSSATLTWSFLSRQTQGAGTYAADAKMPGSLAIIAPLGRSDHMTLSLMREIVVTHCLNHAPLAAWWSPENSTLEAALTAALAGWFPQTQGAAGGYVFFDGQFGSVYTA